MTDAAASVRFGVFENFKGADTLLIWGDREALTHLHGVFHSLATGAARTALMNEQPWAVSVGSTELRLALRDSGSAMKVRKSGGVRSVEWHGSPEHFAEYAEKVEVLVAPASRSGHQYLDLRGEPLQVLVSLGEYPADLSP